MSDVPLLSRNEARIILKYTYDRGACNNAALSAIDSGQATVIPTAELEALRARVAELETRLEITPDHPCDGIACRDQTIDALENRCVYLDAGLAEKEREIEATERNISSAMDTIHKQDWQIAQLERAFAIAKYHCRPDHRDFVELQRIATALDQERGK